jgi:predicted neutral ceramidase superfamily lipid hydrolase
MTEVTKKEAILLANFIRMFHIGVILFMVLVPFIGSVPFIILHITFGISILVHWLGNNNMCSLTLLESKLRGIKMSDGFIHQFIAPVYSIPKFLSQKLLYIILIVLIIISILKVGKSKQWTNFINCLNKKSSDNKINHFFRCFRQLFM